MSGTLLSCKKTAIDVILLYLLHPFCFKESKCRLFWALTIVPITLLCIKIQNEKKYASRYKELHPKENHAKYFLIILLAALWEVIASNFYLHNGKQSRWFSETTAENFSEEAVKNNASLNFDIRVGDFTALFCWFTVWFAIHDAEATKITKIATQRISQRPHGPSIQRLRRRNTIPDEWRYRKGVKKFRQLDGHHRQPCQPGKIFPFEMKVCKGILSHIRKTFSFYS